MERPIPSAVSLYQLIYQPGPCIGYFYLCVNKLYESVDTAANTQIPASGVKMSKTEREKQRDVTHRDRVSETAQYSMLKSARNDRMDWAGETADHRQVHKAKGQPVSGSVGLHCLVLLSLSHWRPLYLPRLSASSSHSAALGSCVRFHARIPIVL